MRSSSVPRCLLRALLAFAAVATVVVVDAADLDRAAKRTLGRRYPLYHYEILDNFENQHDDGSTYLVMFRHGAATHTTDQKFLNLYYPFRDDNRAPEYIIERLQWNDPELTEEGVRSAHALAQQFSQLVWPYVLENSEKVVFLASSMARALRTALITVPTRLLEEINAKWIVSDDLRGRNSGFGTAWRRSVELTSYHCPKEIVSSALGDGVQSVHRSHWVTTNSMTSAYANEAVDFSQLSNVDPLRIVPEFSGYGLFDAFGTIQSNDINNHLSRYFETTESAMNRVAEALYPVLRERPALVVVAAHQHTIEYALHLGRNVGRIRTPEEIGTAKMFILKIRIRE